MVLKELLKDIEFEATSDISNLNIEHLTLDTRQAKAGSLYFAIRGLVTDGHRYLNQAKEKGATAAVVEEFMPVDIPQIKVRNTRLAMSLIASAFNNHPCKRLKFIGVTGTNGKTSITYIVRTIYEQLGVKTGVIGTSGIYINRDKLDVKIATSTTPDPIEMHEIYRIMVEQGVEVVIMEVTAQALYLYKVAGIVYDVGIFTNLTQDHLDFFGTLNTYKTAKKRLFEKGRTLNAVVNADDACGAEIIQENNNNTISYAIRNNADLRAKNIEIFGQRCVYTLVYKNKEYPINLNITGIFNVYNTMAAIGSALCMGIDIETAIKGVEAFEGIAGRYETPDMQGKPYHVVIDYAHTPDGLENILKTIAQSKKNRVIAVFGCGGDRDAGKRPIMGKIAATYADWCVITSDNPRFEEPMKIIEDIVKGIPEEYKSYNILENRKEAIKFALQMAHKDDIILIAGKGDEDYQEIKGVKHPFNDKAVVRELLSEI